jgi:hypothetical protein
VALELRITTSWLRALIFPRYYNAFVDSILEAANAGDENAAGVDITLGNGHTLVLYGRVSQRRRVAS